MQYVNIQDRLGNNIVSLTAPTTLEYANKMNEGGGATIQFPYHTTSNQGILGVIDQLESAGLEPTDIIWKRVEITDSGIKSDNTQYEVTLWKGFIVDIMISPLPLQNNLVLTCVDTTGFLKFRNITTAIDTTASPVATNTIITNLINQINSTFNTGITLGTNDITTTIAKRYEVGNPVLDILIDIANTVNAQFGVDINGELNFSTIIGEDKTTGANYTEFVYDKDNPESTNLVDCNLTYQGSQFASSIIGKSNSTYDTQTDLIIANLIEYIDNFSNLDQTGSTSLTAQVTNLLNKKKSILLKPYIKPHWNPEIAAGLNIGDKIVVYINAGGIPELTLAYTIMSKEVKISPDGAEYAIIISDNILDATNLQDENETQSRTILDIKNDLAKLLLKP